MLSRRVIIHQPNKTSSALLFTASARFFGSGLRREFGRVEITTCVAQRAGYSCNGTLQTASTPALWQHLARRSYTTPTTGSKSTSSAGKKKKKKKGDAAATSSAAENAKASATPTRPDEPVPTNTEVKSSSAAESCTTTSNKATTAAGAGASVAAAAATASTPTTLKDDDVQANKKGNNDNSATTAAVAVPAADEIKADDYNDDDVDVDDDLITYVGDDGIVRTKRKLTFFPCVKPDAPDQLLPEERWGEIEYRDNPNALMRIQRLPLTLIEEMPALVRMMTEIELLQTAWTEEQAERLKATQTVLRVLLFLSLSFFVWLVYTVTIAAERKKRGKANIPQQIKIGSVVYFDVSEEGRDPKRIVIGLFIDKCPLYCEYFHRMCTGNTLDGSSFVGKSAMTLLKNHAVLYGDGVSTKHHVPDFSPTFLPTESESDGPWRGALSVIQYQHHRESPNFAFHLSAGDYTPQVFGMVIGGFDVIERINKVGSRQGAAPRRDFVIEACGELCTLDKSKVTPLPWALYSDVSYGYDRVRFADRNDGVKKLNWYAMLDEEQERVMKEAEAVEAASRAAVEKSKKRFWIF
eukprot:PhM_4_TR3513/c0_g1_i1/m.54780